MDARTGSEPALRFGVFELDVRSRELRNGGTCVRLQEQPFEILRLMLERPGDIVSRDELRKRLWPDGTFVDFEHSLNAAVKRLRAALGDDADNPRFVETLPRRGYRFIAPVGSGTRATGDGPASAAVAHLARVAVLPFSNLSGESSQQYFSDGLTEEMIAQLGLRCGGRIGVLARWSSMIFRGSTAGVREIGEALRADYVLEGSVRCDGDRVRITARLVETAGETHLWAETYERHLTDCLSVQADVAARIAQSLAMELLPEQRGVSRTRSPEAAAYQAYLKGRFYWNKPGDEGLEEAVSYFDQALTIDPGFGAAHASKARALVAQAEYYNASPRFALEAARASAARALELDPYHWRAHVALGDVHRLLEWNWPAAEREYARAIELNPSSESAHRAYGVLLAVTGQSQDAVREADRALELDPLCLVVGTTAAWVRYVSGDYDEVIVRCRHSIDMDERYGFSLARRLLAAAYLQAGRPREAVAELEHVLASGELEPIVLAWLVHARAVSGDMSGAARLMEQLLELERERHVPACHVALAHVGLGDHDRAFAALDRACLDRDPALVNLAIDPRFAPLRADSRHAQLMFRLGLAHHTFHEAHTA